MLRAYDEELDDAVAIKVLAENWAEDQEIRERFVEEARLLRRVRSESLITVHDIGELADGRPYFVMDFADAGTVAGRLAARSAPGLDPPSARALIDTLADGLSALHAEGVIHRDVNPKNLLLRHARGSKRDSRAEQATQVRSGLIGADERIVLGDLGLAKDVVRAGSNAVSVVGGTAHYMPPEQADPVGSVGPETDVYAATGVLWECLTGTPPPDPANLVSQSVGMDERWRVFFATGMASERANRYPSMAEWRAAALNCVADETQLTAGFRPGRRLAVGEHNPYMGLAAFQPEDADRFFGRAALIDELTARLRSHRLLVVAGPSGSGKSSLVRAGLIPAIAVGAIEGSDRWPIALMTPGSQPMAELGYQLSKLATATTKQVSTSVSAADLGADPTRGRLVAEIVTDQTGGMLIVLDQFEELFTQGPDRAGQQKFLEVLAGLVDPADSKVRVVLAVRADFYGRCASFPWLAEKINANQVLVGPMTRPELREAIEEPARHAGLIVEEGVIDAVLDDGGDEPGTLPLVSHALAETWQRRRGATLTLDGYLKSGGVTGAIAQTANALYDDKFDAAEREAVRRLMLRLVNPGEGTPDTRRALPVADLTSGDDGGIMARVANEMTDARLLTVAEETVEIAHEALIRTWPRLREWIEESRDDLRTRQHVARAAGEWIEQDRDPDLLYRGTPLQSALEWAETRPQVLEPLDIEFLEASRHAFELAVAERERSETRARNIRRVAVSILSVLTIVATFAGIAAIRASQQANARFAQSLATQAAGLIDDDPRLAIALAVEAIARGQADSFEARTTLIEAGRVLAESPLAAGASVVNVGDALAIDVAPDGQVVAAGYRNGTLRLWDPMQGVALADAVTGHEGAINDVKFSPDGRAVFTASNDGTLRRWDLTDQGNSASGRVIAEHGGIIWRIAVSPDGSLIASASEDGTVRIWDASTGARVGEPVVETTRDFLSVDFSPDGRTLLAGNGRGEIHGWDVAAREPSIETFNPHSSDLWEIAQHPSNGNFATSSSDGRVRIWNRSGELLGEPYAGPAGNAAAILYSSAGMLMIGTADGRVGMWNEATETLDLTPHGHSGQIIDTAATLDDSEVVTLATDQTMRAWTPASSPLATSWDGHEGGAFGIAISANGTVASGDGVGTVRLYRGDGGPALIAGVDATGPVWATAFDESGASLAVGDSDGDWWLIDVASAAADVGPISGHDGPITAMVFGGDIVVTGGGDGFVRLWNRDGTLQRQLGEAHAGAVTGLAYHDGRLATSDQSGVIRFYDLGRGELIGEPFAADDNSVWGIAFSPDGSRLGTASADEVVSIWDVDSLDLVVTLATHGSAATGVAFLDNATAATLGRDGTLGIWDLALGRQLGSSLVAHGGDSWRVVSPRADGTVVTSSTDGSVKVWNVLDLDVACEKSGAVFDAEQRRRYLGDDGPAKGCQGAMS